MATAKDSWAKAATWPALVLLLGVAGGCSSSSHSVVDASISKDALDAGVFDTRTDAADERPPGDGRVGDGGLADLLPAGGPPPPWSMADVGAVTVPGRTSAAAGIFFLTGGGAQQIGGSADAFHFLFQRVTGDAVLHAHLSELERNSPATRAGAGLMMRSTLAPGSAYVALIADGLGKLFLQRRTTDNGPTENLAVATAAPWLRMSRMGDQVVAWTSADMKEWTEVGRQAIALPATLSTGLAVTGPATAVFHTARLSAVPAPWNDSDIGDVAIPGGARITTGPAGEPVVVLTASGSDIAGPSDQFTFLHRSFPADGELSVRVANFSFVDANSKVGIMFRADLTAGSPHLSLVLTPLGTQVLRRSARGEATISVRSQFGQLPARWLRVARIGQTLTCLVSMDGVRWMPVHVEPMPMSSSTPSTMPLPAPLPALPEVGLVVSARNNSRVSMANLDNLVLRSFPPVPPDLADAGTDASVDAGAGRDGSSDADAGADPVDGAGGS